MTPERYVLGIDTATRLGSIALAVDGKAVSSAPLPPGGHSSGLSGAAKSLLRERGIRWEDLAGVAVSEGPGSFTGLRIGLAWAKGVCLGSGVELALVSAHEANAHRHRREAVFIGTVLPGEPECLQGALWEGGERVTNQWGPESCDWLSTLVRLQTALTSAIVYKQVESSLPNDMPWLVVACPDMKPDWLEMFRDAFRRIAPDSGPPTATAVAELGDGMLVAGEKQDLATAAPAYGRAPNARKPTS